MADIISLSLNKAILKTLGKVEKDLGFSGRSEAIRHGIRLLASESKNLAMLSGRIDAVLLVVHQEARTTTIFSIIHDYQHFIRTHVHNHLEEHKCLEMFTLHGEGAKISQLVRAVQKEESFVKLLII